MINTLRLLVKILQINIKQINQMVNSQYLADQI